MKLKNAVKINEALFNVEVETSATRYVFAVDVWQGAMVKLDETKMHAPVFHIFVSCPCPRVLTYVGCCTHIYLCTSTAQSDLWYAKVVWYLNRYT